ncbi:uncharacterized protein LOC118422986 [Branchiostoma floridae]|uniref:Uncharacterized protein LOC118422986 n=1 Tax=Branchiostoma floridae TaxID=7739 RepID=A0A9J7LR96_BRAFL|nr:uncharacterized protein LOC118422986 [Branchiostoma floridae]
MDGIYNTADDFSSGIGHEIPDNMDRDSPDSTTETVNHQGIHGDVVKNNVSVSRPDVQVSDVKNQEEEDVDQNGSRPETIKYSDKADPEDQQDIPASPEEQEDISLGNAEHPLHPLQDDHSNASAENSDQDGRPFYNSNNVAGRTSLPAVCTSYSQIGKGEENQALYMKRRSLPAMCTSHTHAYHAERNQTLYVDNPGIDTEKSLSKDIYNTDDCSADNEVQYQLKSTSPETSASAYQCGGDVANANMDRPDIEVENAHNEAEDEAGTRPKTIKQLNDAKISAQNKAETKARPDNEFIRPYAVAYCRDSQINGEQDVQPYAVAYDEQDGHNEDQTGRSVNNPQSGNKAVSSDECIRPYAVRYQLDGQTNGDQDDACDVQPYAVAYDVQDGHCETQTPTGRCADSSQPGSTAEAVDNKAGGLRPNPMYSGNGLHLNPMYAPNITQPRAGEANACALTRSCLAYVITTGVVVTVITVLAALIIAAFLPGKQNNQMQTTWTEPSFTGKTTRPNLTAKTTCPTFTDTTTDDVTRQVNYTSSPPTSTAENENKDLEQTTIVFGGEGKEPGQLDGPKAVVVSPSNEMFVADTYNRRVQVFSMTGVYLRHFPAVISGEASETIEPEDISMDGEGHLWVVGDKDNDLTGFIVRYTTMGHHLATLRATFTNDSFIGITVDTPRNLVVVTEFWIRSDYGEVKLLHFNGTVVRKFRTEKGPEYPGRVAVGREGNLLVSDLFVSDIPVYVYNNTGHYLSSFGGDRIGDGEAEVGQRILVMGMCTDISGDVLVGTGFGGTVERFTQNGRYVRSVATNMSSSCGVAVTPGGQLVVTDYYDSTVTIFSRY